jgi:hypothetical protein
MHWLQLTMAAAADQRLMAFAGVVYKCTGQAGGFLSPHTILMDNISLFTWIATSCGPSFKLQHAGNGLLAGTQVEMRYRWQSAGAL